MPKTPPPIGSVQGNYRYNGGDPAAKGSWTYVNPQEQQQGTVSNAQAPGAGYFTGAAPAPKLSAPDSKYLTAQRDAAQQGQSMRADVNRFVDLNKQVPTGGLPGLLAPVAGIFDPKVAEMRAISERLTPQQRTAGSGAMSDRDVEMYRAATVGNGKPGSANQALARVVEAGSRRQGDYSAFLEEWAKRNGGLIGAEEAWQSFAEANPLFDASNGNTRLRPSQNWRQWFGLEQQRQAAPPPAGRTQSAPPNRARAPSGAAPSRLKWTPESGWSGSCPSKLRGLAA